MQVASMPCGHCGEKIVTAEEGTWCAVCQTRYHRECLKQKKSLCPTCGKSYVEPESWFVYSKSCPKCHRPTNGQAEFCPRCHAPTIWHTKEEFEEFKAGYVQGHLVYLYAGLGLIALGVLALASVVLEILEVIPCTFHLTLHLGVAAVIAGGWFVWHYTQASSFE